LIDIDALYSDLRSLAAAYLRRESSSVTLQPTALVNEALLRIGSWSSGPGLGQPTSDSSTKKLTWSTPEDFFAVASHVMRRVLVDAARRRKAQKRAGPGINLNKSQLAPAPARNIGLNPDLMVSPPVFARDRADEVLLLNEALESLELMDPNCARLVQLRFYLGLTVAEAAEALGVSLTAADTDWQVGKAWLARWLRKRGS
jgi:RNA polymerase sigma factor (TIGR02999 family)